MFCRNLGIYIFIASLVSLAYAQDSSSVATATTPSASTSPETERLSQLVVRPGDTLWQLAHAHQTSVEALMQLNQLSSPTLEVGMVLRLPSNELSHQNAYVVKEGDTLFDIAVAYNIAIEELIAYNNLVGSMIYPGQSLSLSAPVNNPPSPLTITVQSGDSLWQLARDYEINIHDLVAANNLSIDAVIHPGTVVTIPGRYASSTTDLGGSATPSIIVTEGMSLWEIAESQSTTVTALMSANGLSDTRIYTGQQLKIVPGSDLLPASSAQQSVPSASMVWPLKGPITSRFGYRTLFGGSNMHYGLDIDGVTGDPIIAAVAGTVIFSGRMGGFGNLVVIQAADQTEYRYAHASKLLVSEGDVVEMGEIIAEVGSTGVSTGSHLHFEIRQNGEALDPLKVLEQLASN